MEADRGEAPRVMGADGQFHATDEAVDLSGTPLEGWVALGLFWLLGATVFYQFVTRYVLNDSASWTEEIARYLLIGTVFVGAAIGVAKNNHIQVDLLYRYLPQPVGRALALAVDGLRIAFFGAMAVYTVQMMRKLDSYKMTIIDLPMNIVYGVCFFGLAAMALRSVWVMRLHWRRGWSVLERPEGVVPPEAASPPPPQGGAAGGPAEPDPRRPLDGTGPRVTSVAPSSENLGPGPSC